MPIPNFTVTGNLRDVVATPAGGEIPTPTWTGAYAIFAHNIKDGVLVWEGKVYNRPPSVKATVDATTGNIEIADMPVSLLANDPGLNVTGIQWRCDIKTSASTVIASFWFDAPEDGGTVDLATVAHVPTTAVNQVLGLTVAGLLAQIQDSGSDIHAAIAALAGSGGGGGGTPDNGSVTAAKFNPSTLVTAAETIAANNNDTTIPTSAATSAAIDAAVAALVNGAPGALDTLKELADQLASDESAVAALTTAVSNKAPLASPSFTGTVSGVSKAMVGLGNVDNTSDANKPVSTAQAAADATRQPLDADLTAIAALTTTAFGRSLLTQADAAATRTSLGVSSTTETQAYAKTAVVPGVTENGDGTLTLGSASRRLPWQSGTYAVHDAALGQAFSTYRGQPIDHQLVFPVRDTWPNILNNWWAVRSTPEQKLNVAVTLWPTTGSVNTDYTTQWQSFAALLRDGDVVRLGWEQNLPSAASPATSTNLTAWAAAFASAAATIKKVNPNILIELCLCMNPSQTTATNTQIIDACVGSFDILSTDFYWWYVSGDTDAAWNAQIAQDGGLDWIRLKANSIGVPYAVAEWGIAKVASNGTGDSAFFVNKMFAYFAQYPPAHEAYFNASDDTGTGYGHYIYPATINPIASAAYAAKIAAATTVVKSVVPTKKAFTTALAGKASLDAVVSPQTGTAYTVAAADDGKVVTLSNASATTLTFPQDSVAAFPIGGSVEFHVLGAGQVTCAAGSGATVNSRGGALKSAGQYAVIRARKRAANTWIISGDITTALAGVSPIVAQSNGYSQLNNSQSPSITFAGYTPVAGDVVVMFPRYNSADRTITVPSGWVNPLGGNTLVASDSNQSAVLYHVVTSSEASAVTNTFTLTNLWSAALYGSVVGSVLRGVSASTPVDAVATSFNSGDTTTPHVIPGLAGADLSTGSLVLASVSRQGDGAYGSGPGGWTEITSTANYSSTWYGRLTAGTVAGTDVPAASVTPSVGDEYTAITIAFNAA